MTVTFENKVTPQMVGLIPNMNAFCLTSSASRMLMWAAHSGQILTLLKTDEPVWQSGAEYWLGKCTYSAQVDVDVKIIAVVTRYPTNTGRFKMSPEVVVWYEEINTGVIGALSIPYYHSAHQYFGFVYQKTKAYERITAGSEFKAGTIFADSPAKHENGGYGVGRLLNVAKMIRPDVAEDGIVMNRASLEKFKFSMISHRKGSFGANTIPTNMNGDSENFKFIPDIGDYIRPDGLVMASRNKEPGMSVINMSKSALMEPDHTFDRQIFSSMRQQEIDGIDPMQFGGRVVDVKVYRVDADLRSVPTGMTEQLDKYVNALRSFHQQMLDIEKNLRNLKHGNLVMTDQLKIMLYEARMILSMKNTTTTDRVIMLHKKSPVDTYTVELSIQHDVVPDIGFKLTGFHGNKGVICSILEPENMPMDAEGNRADIIVNSQGIINRTNLGQLFEGEGAAGARDGLRRIMDQCGLVKPKTMFEATRQIKTLYTEKRDSFDWFWDRIIEFYGIVNPIQEKHYAGFNDQKKIDHLAHITLNQIKLFMRVDNVYKPYQILRNIKRNPLFRPTKSKLFYKSIHGKDIVTKKSMYITVEYYTLLEKIATDWSSIAHTSQQHLGFTTTVPAKNKYRLPWSDSPVRAYGETEIRIILSYLGRETAAEIMDQANSLQTQAEVVSNIIKADHPGGIKKIVDRKKIPFGSSRPLQLVNHILLCRGTKMIYEPEGESAYGATKV